MRYCEGSVHVVQHMGPGGIETLVLDLLASGSTHDRVFSLEGNTEDLAEAWTLLPPLGSRFEAFGKRPGKDLGLVFRLRKRLAALRPAAVFVHHIGPLIYGGTAARLARCPKLVHVEHDVWQYEKGGSGHSAMRRRTIAALFFRALRPEHIAVSATTAETVARISGSSKVRVIAPGVRLDRFRPADEGIIRKLLGLNSTIKVIGSVGRLSEEKGHLFLIRSISSCANNVHLVLVGDGPMRPVLEAEVRQLGLGQRVHFMGHRDDVEALMPGFDIFCLPSLNEGLPRTLLEAQACGVPVVASDTGGVREAVCPATGLMVQPGNPETLRAAFLEVLSRDHAGDPRAFIAAKFSFEKTLTSFNEFSVPTK